MLNLLSNMEITERNNVFIEIIDKCRRNNKKVYVLGAGSGGKIVYKGISSLGLEIDGFVVDRDVEICNKEVCGKEVTYIDSIDKGSLIIIAIREYDEKKIDQIEKDYLVIYEDFMVFWTLNGEYFDYDFAKNNADKLHQTYEMLHDQYSKKCMSSFINSKISGKREYLEDVWEKEQYYVPSIIDFSSIDTFVDCGAYDGDSYQSFIEAYLTNTKKNFMGNAILFEADSGNYLKLCQNTEGDDRVKTYKLGVSSGKGIIKFSDGDDTSSKLSSVGTAEIKVDSLDHIIFDQTKIDYIKMDIEGCELDALRGGANIIKKYHPQMAICVYHKKEDLIEIPLYIHYLYDGYIFYLRAHRPWSQELVLYAIPQNK